jgi:hypothetical protein
VCHSGQFSNTPAIAQPLDRGQYDPTGYTFGARAQINRYFLYFSRARSQLLQEPPGEPPGERQRRQIAHRDRRGSRRFMRAFLPSGAHFRGSQLFCLILILFWNSIYFTFHFFQKSRNQELNNISLEASKNEIELKNLRSQLNPHFLFNSLNSIRALIDIEPQNAKGAVTTLSNLLRKSLILGKEDLVPLNEEMEMVSNYLELEKVRFEERLTVEWKLDEKLDDFLIPPFSLQMLVENAIKHGISKLPKGGSIDVNSEIKNQLLEIKISNDGKFEENSISDSGFGLKNSIELILSTFLSTTPLI